MAIRFNDGEGMTNKANKWIKAAMAELKRTFPYRCKCKRCKDSSKLQFAHKRKTPLSLGAPRGRKEKYYDIVNHPKSYILMTKEHHNQRFKLQHKRFRKEAQK